MAMNETSTNTTNKLKGALDCASARCSMEAGCRRESDGSWICICTQDFSIPRADGSCPRIVVAQYPPQLRKDSTEGTFINSWQKKSIETWMAGDFSDEISVPVAISTNEWIVLALSTSTILLFLAAIAVFLFLRQRKIYCRRINNLDRTVQLTHGNELLEIDATEQHRAEQDARFILLREWIQLEEEIGQGCFGQVYRGRLNSGQQGAYAETVAIKIVKNPGDREAERDLIREARTMAKFSHPNILEIRGIVFNEGQAGRTWLVFEYMSIGDLAQLLRISAGVFSTPTIPITGEVANQFIILKERDLMSMAEQIASGMAYLSSKSYVHRDLACRNCLVNQLHQGNTQGNPGIYLVKISDFGMSRDIHSTDYYRIAGRQNMLPVRWMSPESILYGKFSIQSDVWSYGVVLWEIFTKGAQPNYGHSNEEAVQLILDGILLIPPESASLLICQILHGCWKSRPDDRLTFQQIDDQLMDDQRVRRSHIIIQDNMMCNYIIPNLMDVSVSPIRIEDSEQSTIVTLYNSKTPQAIASVSITVTPTDPYLQLIISDLDEDILSIVNPPITMTVD